MDEYGDGGGVPAIRTTPYASPFHQFQGSIQLLTNPDEELRKLELSLRNVILDEDGIAHAAGRPLMNEEGIASVISQVQALVNRVTVMSSLEPVEIIQLVYFLADTLCRDLMITRVRYGIENPVDRDRILFAALSSAYICMKRASEEGERRFWKGSQQEITTRVDGAMPKKKGFLSSVVGWGK